MKKNHLSIVYTESSTPKRFVKRLPQAEEMRAKMERLWLKSPRQFDPSRNCIERQRVINTVNAITSCISLSDKSAVDLGCAAGTLSRKLRDLGALVDAVDIATQALNLLKSEDLHHITPIQDYLPTTSLNDQAYDLVVCTEVIGYLDARDYRMLMAELARLVKNDGWVVCSTSLDINTDHSLERFSNLAETEFTIEKWVLSYHRLQIRLSNFFKTPSNYVNANKNSERRNEELSKRKGFFRWWFACNSSLPVSIFWRILEFLFRPIVYLLSQNTGVMNFLEKVTRFFWSDSGISHALFLGKRRPLTFPVAEDKAPRELKHKRQVWE